MTARHATTLAFSSVCKRLLATMLSMVAIPSPGRSAESPESPSAAVSASNAFGLELYRRLATATAGNVFISPYSVMNALSMTASGARGRTAVEMHSVLHIPARPEAVHAGLSALNRRLTNPGDASGAQSDPTEMEVANALWAEKTCPFAKSYLSTVTTYYGADILHQADFRGDFEAERLRINRWVEDKTRDRIKDLLPPGSVDPTTRLVLTNAIYFKGKWENAFDAAQTRDEDFLLADGQKGKASLMQRRSAQGARYGAFNADGTFFETPVKVALRDGNAPRYPGEDGFAMVELPYRGGKIAMVVIAPNRADGLPVIEDNLNAETVAGWIGQLRPREVDVYLPRFKTETAYTLNETLIAMGMQSAFRPGSADFSGMMASENSIEQFYIGLVVHKAFVDVNEEGTEAAAATGVTMRATAIAETIPFTPVFRADRPFLYLIRDVETGCLLFVGRTTKP